MKKLQSAGLAGVTFMYIIAIAFSIMALTWIDKLEKTACQCSVDFKRDYIKYYLYCYVALYTIMYIIVVYMMYFFNPYMNSISLGFINIIQMILPFFALLNVVFSIMYIWKLKETDCKCSEDIRREIYYVLNWINVGFIALAIIITFFLAIAGMFFMGRFLK